MSYGMVLLLGWQQKNDDLVEIGKKLGVNIYFYEEDGFYLESKGKTSSFNFELRELHEDIARDIFGFTLLPSTDSRYMNVNTPLGDRELWYFTLELLEDEYERNMIGDSVLGIPLSSRYSPTLFDWESPSGSLEAISLTGDLLKKFEETKKEIVKVFPVFESVYPIVKFKEY